MQIFARIYQYLKKTPSLPWWGFGISVIVIVVMLLIWPSKPRDSKEIEKELKSLRESNKHLQAERNRLGEVLAEKDIAIKNYQTQDSILSLKVDKQSLIIKEINKKYESLNRIDKFTAADIQRYFSNEYQR